jgi:hypothetical protein
MTNLLRQYKDQIVFRFTIGSIHDDILKFWEPGAPSFGERYASLIYAFEKGYKTSISAEPFLDEDWLELYHRCKDYITDSFWLGKMNQMKKRIDTGEFKPSDWMYYTKVETLIKDDMIKIIYDVMKDKPKVRFKDSIKKVIGLPDEAVG